MQRLKRDVKVNECVYILQSALFGYFRCRIPWRHDWSDASITEPEDNAVIPTPIITLIEPAAEIEELKNHWQRIH